MSEAKHTAFTPGPWHAPHFCDEASTCNCQSVVSECYAGAICTVEFDNGLRIEDGGNDAPPLEEAKSNARLIAAAPELFEACQEFVRKVEAGEAKSKKSYAQMKAALLKAGGRS